MGKLRKELKKKEFLSGPEYHEILSVLQQAQKAAADHHVYWDLEEGEKIRQVKKSFLYVAEKENIDIKIRQVRGTHSLALQFKKAKNGPHVRMSAAESRRRILKCLENDSRPLKKNRIITQTGISASTWNIRIKELLNAGLVNRHGDRRDTTYTLAKPIDEKKRRELTT